MSIPPKDLGADLDMASFLEPGSKRGSAQEPGADAPKARPTPPALERRVQMRKPLRTRVVLTMADAPPVVARCIDISASGMGLVADVSLRGASTCQLAFVIRFNDGSTYTAEVSARIAYCVLGNDMKGFKIGAQFSGLSERASAAVQRYLKG
jgi:c-di-GMP-binding flagellar brake protein YcgR